MTLEPRRSRLDRRRQLAIATAAVVAIATSTVAIAIAIAIIVAAIANATAAIAVGAIAAVALAPSPRSTPVAAVIAAAMAHASVRDMQRVSAIPWRPRGTCSSDGRVARGLRVGAGAGGLVDVYSVRYVRMWYCDTDCKKLVFRSRTRPHPICSART